MMIEVLERTRSGQPMPWQSSTYYALAADVRTEVAASWQTAAELAQIDPALTGDAQRLQLLEALTHLLDALAYLDVAVEQPALRAIDAGYAQRCWSRYADTVAHAQTAAQAAKALSSTRQAPSLGQASHARLQRSITQLRRHIDALGRLISARHTVAA
ncbi:MAG: hypothetical protein ACR2JY_15565 [Chloroflexota bacterium]